MSLLGDEGRTVDVLARPAEAPGRLDLLGPGELDRIGDVLSRLDVRAAP